MTACPLCGAGAGTGTLDTLLRSHGITGHPEAVLRAVWAAGGRATTTEQMFDWLYADDPDGGPPQGRMYADLRAAIETVNSALAGTLQIVPIGNRSGRWRLRISICGFPADHRIRTRNFLRAAEPVLNHEI